MKFCVNCDNYAKHSEVCVRPAGKISLVNGLQKLPLYSACSQERGDDRWPIVDFFVKRIFDFCGHSGRYFVERKKND